MDDKRMAKIHMAARLILERPERHTPLELRWAKEVFDLTCALQEARDQLRRT